MKFRKVEALEKELYIFDGPVYTDNGMISPRTVKRTRACSHAEAVQNIKKQFYAQLHIWPSFDASLVKIDTYKPKQKEVKTAEPEQLKMF